MSQTLKSSMPVIEQNRAYHVKRAIAAREGIDRYRRECVRCHGCKIHTVQTVQRHHRLHGRDIVLIEPLLVSTEYDHGVTHNVPPDTGDGTSNAEFVDAPASEEFMDAPLEEANINSEEYDNCEGQDHNTDINLEDMAQNYFGRADAIHNEIEGGNEAALDFDEDSSAENKVDNTELLESLLWEANQPLYPGSTTNCLKFSIILMSLRTLFGVSHHCLDEVLTFLKQDVLPPKNKCPKNSYELKAKLAKLGLSHETIHWCSCGKVLYWKENARLQHSHLARSLDSLKALTQYPLEC